MANKANLQHWMDIYFECLLACTGFVGIGLLLEVFEIKHDVLEAIGRKSREHKYWLALPIDRKEYPEALPRAKVLSAAGWVLIVLGVIGEGVFEGFVSKYDTALSSVTDTIVAEAQKESAHAEATAKGFEAQIAESNAKAKSAEATAKGFEAQIAEAHREAEADRLARIKIEEKMAWRTVPPEKQQAIVSQLKKFSGQPFTIRTFQDDDEAVNLTRIVLKLLLAAGWNRKESPHVMAFVHLDGISVEVAPSRAADFEPAAKALASALNNAGIDAVEKINPGEDNASNASMIHVRVGKKPQKR